MFLKKEFLKNFTKIKRKQLCWSLFFNKDSGQMFSYEFSEVFKNNFFTEHFPTTSSFCNLSHRFILQRSLIYLFEPSFVRKIDKNSQFCHLFILQIYFMLYIVNAFYTTDQNINTRNHVSLMR